MNKPLTVLEEIPAETDVQYETLDSLSRERDSLLKENHRLRDLVRAADIVHIRLRDVLRIALARVTAQGDEADIVWAAGTREQWLK